MDVLCHFDEDDSIGWKEMARYDQLKETPANPIAGATYKINAEKSCKGTKF